MIARDVQARSGITLTEILIAILIMGVGLISLATLFPLGLIRLREATRQHRAGIAYEVAADDMDTRDLFYKPSYTQTWYWIANGNQKVPRDPFVQDAYANATVNGAIASNPLSANGVVAGTNPPIPLLVSGLPFCYDPLWRSITGVMPYTPNGTLTDPTLVFNSSYVTNTPDEARFGAGVFSNGQYPYIRPDPDQFTVPSAYGLQRLTNFIPWVNPSTTPSLNYQFPFTTLNASLSAGNQPQDVAGSVFTSNDDIVFNSFTGNPNTPSPLVPDTTYGLPTVQYSPPQADYRFTWFITGRQVDAGGNGSQFSGEVVVCDGRPFGWDPLPGQAFNGPAGEVAVEAIFGYGSNIPNVQQSGTGFATGADKTVLLRWPTSLPDPQVRVGGWICDVTYERNASVYASRRQVAGAALTGTSFVRCNWYQVGKRTDPQPDTTGLPSPSPYRMMVLTITSPVKNKTLLSTNGQPVHVNVALVMPSVINVFPRAFESIPIQTP
jgi:type II secretory pathway pseudopilin PulG